MFWWYLEQLWQLFLCVVVFYMIYLVVREIFRDVKKENERRKNIKRR